MTTDAVSSASAQAIYDSINRRPQTTTEANSAEDTQNRFLRLLTTQLKNQDPLSPMDNAQITSQLAQISTVDGITKLNTTLKGMLDNSSASQTLQAASVVGKHVLVPGSDFALAGSSAAGGFELGGDADRVEVTIKDGNGLAVRKISLGALSAGTQTFSWDGKTDTGAQAADGQYTISIAALKGTNEVTATALQFGLVGSVANNGRGLTINVNGLGSFGLSEVRQII